LTLQVLAYQAGIFTRQLFLVLFVTTLLSISLCSVGALVIDYLYLKVLPIVAFLDKPNARQKKRELEKGQEFGGTGSFWGHVVILGFNETGQDIAEFFREQKQEVLVVDLDPVMHESFKFAYKGVRGHRVPRCKPIEPLEPHQFASTLPTPSRATPSRTVALTLSDAEGHETALCPHCNSSVHSKGPLNTSTTFKGRLKTSTTCPCPTRACTTRRGRHRRQLSRYGSTRRGLWP